jgi:hypothetical protein
MPMGDAKNHIAVRSPGPARSLIALCAALFSVIAVLSLKARAVPEVPRERLQVSAGWADESSCVECHDQGRTFWETGHARTLRRANDPASLALLGRLRETPAAVAEGIDVQIEAARQKVPVTSARADFVSRAGLDWCFGSGAHAQTWVATLSDSHNATDLLEFRWSWYHSTDTFALTPGQPDHIDEGYYGGLGWLFDQPLAQRCFSCHSSHLPVESGHIRQDQIKAGVTCQRCHGPRAEHVASQGRIHDPFWANVDQQESVNRCAECHRRAEEEKPENITQDNTSIVRFQPVGLTQSKCFTNSDMTCVTCHDPHRPLATQDSLGIWQCIQCHDGADSHRPICGARRTDDCLTCHMPKVRMDRPLEFTDHWIRVREVSVSGAKP